jgi:hypothetical protein
MLPVWFTPVWDLENYRSYMLALTKILAGATEP